MTQEKLPHRKELCLQSERKQKAFSFLGKIYKLKMGLEPTTPSLRVKCSTN